MNDPVGRIRRRLGELGADAALLTNLAHVRWSTGFTGSNGVALVDGTRVVFVTDPRYAEQARLECPDNEVVVTSGSFPEALRANSSPYGRIVLDALSLTVAQYRELARQFHESDLMIEAGWLDVEVARKQRSEIERIAAAQALTDDVFARLLEYLRPGVTERQVAAEIVYLHLQAGADRMSFEPIVASGPNGAFPHGRPGSRVLRDCEPVVIDMGCYLDGYASDMTRTVHIGPATNEFAETYKVVLEAQQLAIGIARSGLRADELDGVARAFLVDAGLGDYFVHSLGHGLGLDVHEWPRIGRNSEYVLPDSCVVTIEPGVYLPGKWGIRIEDIVVLSPEGCRNLTRSSSALLELDG